MKYRKFTLWLGGLLLGALCAFVLLFRSWEGMGDLAPVESRLSAWPRSTAVSCFRSGISREGSKAR